MKMRMFTFKLDPVAGTFDDTALTAFFAEHDAIDATEHWFVHDGVPTLTMVVRYREATSRGASSSPHRREVAEGRRGESEATIELEPEHRAIFEALRKWRNDRAKRDGRPPYVLFTNGQLANISRARPETKAALEGVHGVGEARIRDYADDLLALLRTAGEAGG